MNTSLINMIQRYEGPGDFTYSVVTEEIITTAERMLNLEPSTALEKACYHIGNMDYYQSFMTYFWHFEPLPIVRCNRRRSLGCIK